MRYSILIVIPVVFLSFLLGTYKFLSSDGSVLSSSVELAEEVISPTLIPTPTSTPTPSPTPSPTISPTPTLTSTPTLTPTPTITPTPLPFPMLYHEVDELFKRFSGEYSIDYNLLRSIAECESEFNSSVVNGPYAGLFQFSSNTWISNRTEMGQDTNPELRFSGEESVKTAAYLVSRGKLHLWPNCVN